MGYYFRFLACFLAFASGLVYSFPAVSAVSAPYSGGTLRGTYADASSAKSACLAQLADTLTYINRPNPYGAGSYNTVMSGQSNYYDCSTIYSRVVTGVTHYEYACQVTFIGYNSGGGERNRSLSLCNSGTGMPGVVYTGNTPALYRSPTDSVACTGQSEFESLTRRSPLGSGSGAVCELGCAWTVSVGYSGVYPSGYVYWTWIPEGFECVATPETTPTSSEEPPEELKQDADNDGISDKDDTCPNDLTNTCGIPDTEEDKDGDGIPDFRDPYPDDPTNGKGDGEGSGDKNTSSGGGDCIVPPSCAGDPIQCNILFQTWGHRCGKTAGTAGQGPLDGVGDEVDLSPLTDRWDDTFGDYEDTDLGGLSEDQEVDGDFLDNSGLGFSRSCPVIEDFSIGFFGQTISMGIGDEFCDATSWVGSFVALLGVFVGIMAFFRVKG